MRIDNEGRIHRGRQYPNPPAPPRPPFQPPQPPQRSFFRKLKTLFGGLGTILMGLGMYLPQILSVLLFIFCLFTDSDISVKILMVIPCGIVFFTGWKGLIGIVILVGLVQAC